MTRLATQRTGAKLKWAGITDEAQLCQPSPCSRICSVVPQGKLDVEEFKRLLSPKTKMVAFVHISNTLGCINPVSQQQCQCQDFFAESCWIHVFPLFREKVHPGWKIWKIWMSDECHVVPYLAEHCDHRCPRYAGCLKWSPVRSKRWRRPRMPWEPRLESLSCMGQGHNSNNGPQVGCWKWCAYDSLIHSLIGCLDGSTVDSGSLIDSLSVLLVTGWIWMHPDGFWERCFWTLVNLYHTWKLKLGLTFLT